MKLSIICFISSIIFISSLSGQEKILRVYDSYRSVIVPDSIRNKLKSLFSLDPEGFNGLGTFKLTNLKYPSNYKLIDGVYIYWTNDVIHGTLIMFVYKNGKMFVFDCKFGTDQSCFVESFLKCIKELNLSDSEIRNYLLVICKFMIKNADYIDPWD